MNDLERALSSSSDEKDAQIRRLTMTVEELRESSRTRDVLCISLAEETSNLRQQLTDVGTQCQQMALRLENSKAKQGAQLKVNLQRWPVILQRTKCFSVKGHFALFEF